MKIFIYLLFNIFSVCVVHAQQIMDYFTYYLYDSSALRSNFIYSSWAGRYEIDNYNKSLESDNENIYFINNFAGDINLTTYYNDTFIKERQNKELKSSNLYFCRYNFKNHNLIMLPFGSNYDNDVWKVKIDINNKNIFTIISTWDDTIRLDPSNQNNFIAFPDRKQRFWILRLDLNGNLLKYYYLAQADTTYLKTNWNIQQINLSNFNNDDILISFFVTNNVKSLFPLQYNLTNISDSVNYIYSCYNFESNSIKWVRLLKCNYNNFSNIKTEAIGTDMLANVQLSKTDSIVTFSDENGKIKVFYNFNNENINYPYQYYTYIFKFDTWGNIIPLFTIESKQGAKLKSIIQNEKDILAIVVSNDSFILFKKKYKGEYDKRNPVLGFVSLLKLDINNQTSIELIKHGKDSIVPLSLIKSKRGFYINFLYNNTSSEFNLLENDTVINFTGDSYRLNYYTLCKYDTNYKLNWINKTTEIFYLKDHGENIIIEYLPSDYDIDFRPEQIGQIKPIPIMMMAAIYNCKPISYYKSEDIGKNTVKFTNLGEYNCSYKWDFGDGTSTTQKSPYHKFASKTQSYKVSLITTNSCGSDTFYRYYSFSAGLTSFKYNSQIKIYPNPIRGNTIKIEMPENTEIKSVKIYSPTGQQLDECSFDKTEKTNYTATIGSKLSKGIYYVKIILDDNTGYVTKVIIGE